MRIITKPWGLEVHLFAWQRWRVKLLKVNADARTSRQFHRKKQEVMFYPDGSYVVIRPLTPHRLTGPVTVLEVSRGSDDDIIRMEDDYGRV